jgi:hypothetical protein
MAGKEAWGTFIILSLSQSDRVPTIGKGKAKPQVLVLRDD